MDRLTYCLLVFCFTVLINWKNRIVNAERETSSKPQHDKVVACYIAGWAVYRPGKGSFGIDDLDPRLCTHLIYSFAGLNITTNSIYSLDPYNDLEESPGAKGTYRKLTNLKNNHPHLKVAIAIGGWNEGSRNYSIMAGEKQRRSQFISSVVQFIRKYNFDGLDLDWEYPGKRNGNPETDKANFVSLVKELKEEFTKYGWILSAALGAGKDTIDVAYDIPEISQYLDYMHIMCYDYHGSWDKKIGANAPLSGNIKDDVLSVQYTIQYMLNLGAPANKLVVGVPFYGRTFLATGSSNSKHELGMPAEEKGFSGPFTREDGFMGFNEICDELNKNVKLWQKIWDPTAVIPIAFYNNKVVTYDDQESIKKKVQLAILEHNLRGIMVWSIDTDDFHGDCDLGEKFPLMHTINTAIAEAIYDRSNIVPHHNYNYSDYDDRVNGSQNLLVLNTLLFVSLCIVWCFHQKAT